MWAGTRAVQLNGERPCPKLQPKEDPIMTTTKAFSLASLPLLAASAGAMMLVQCTSQTTVSAEAGEDAPGSSSSSSSGSGSSGTGSSSSGSGSGSGGGSSSGTSSSSSGGGALTWYYTCGYPSCPAPSGDAGDAGLMDDAGAPCPAIGSTCAVDGGTCGTSSANFHCGAVEQCAAHDPTMSQFGCPISSRNFKDGIEYVSPEGLQQLHDQTLRFQLATYNYKPDVSDPGPRHLGFIIEDAPPATPAVGWSQQRVDLYGYLSMVVATMQVQEKEIAELRRELASAHSASCR
jgi:hypothetical protein